MKWNIIAVVYIVLVILLAQLIAPAPYNWTQNTVSELAAQGYRNRWIMQAGFVGFGVLLAAAVIRNWRARPSLWYREVPLLLYALCIALSGIFRTRPFVPGAACSETEAQLHSIFATVAGILLSTAVLAHLLSDEDARRKTGHLAALILIMATAMAFGMSSTNTGLIQRFLYLVGFAWIALLYDGTS
jgi:hypothetical membrane protein